MSDTEEKKEPVEEQPTATVVVTAQPTRELPRQWSVGLINGPCCLASFIPCLAWVWTWSNAKKASFLCAFSIG